MFWKEEKDAIQENIHINRKRKYTTFIYIVHKELSISHIFLYVYNTKLSGSCKYLSKTFCIHIQSILYEWEMNGKVKFFLHGWNVELNSGSSVKIPLYINKIRRCCTKKNKAEIKLFNKNLTLHSFWYHFFKVKTKNNIFLRASIRYYPCWIIVLIDFN